MLKDDHCWGWLREAGRVWLTGLRLSFQVGFSLPPTNFKGTKILKGYKKHPPCPVPKPWHSASVINDLSNIKVWLNSSDIFPFPCSPILSARTTLISGHLNSWYELRRQESRQHRENKAILAFWGSKVSILRYQNYSVGKG